MLLATNVYSFKEKHLIFGFGAPFQNWWPWGGVPLTLAIIKPWVSVVWFALSNLDAEHLLAKLCLETWALSKWVRKVEISNH